LRQYRLNFLFIAIIFLGSALSYFLHEKNTNFDKSEVFKTNLTKNFIQDSLLVTSSDFIENNDKQKRIELSEFYIQISKGDSLLFWNKSKSLSSFFFEKSFSLGGSKYEFKYADAPDVIKRSLGVDTALFWTFFIGLTFLYAFVFVKCRGMKIGNVILITIAMVIASFLFYNILFQHSDHYGIDYYFSIPYGLGIYGIIFLIGTFALHRYYLYTKKPGIIINPLVSYILGSTFISITVFFITIFTEIFIINELLNFRSEEILNLSFKEVSYIILTALFAFLIINTGRICFTSPDNNKITIFKKTLIFTIPILVLAAIYQFSIFHLNIIPVLLFLMIILLLLDLYFEYFEINLTFLLISVLIFSVFYAGILYNNIDRKNNDLTQNAILNLTKNLSNDDEKTIGIINDEIINSDLILSLSTYPQKVDINELRSIFKSKFQALKNFRLEDVYFFDKAGRSLALNQISNREKIDLIKYKSTQLSSYVFYSAIDAILLYQYTIENSTDKDNPLMLSITLKVDNPQNITFPYKQNIAAYRSGILVETFKSNENLFPASIDQIKDNQNFENIYKNGEFEFIKLKGKMFFTKFLPIVTLFITAIGLGLLLLIVFNSLWHFIDDKHNLSLNVSKSLRSRFQTIIIGLILFSFILIGATTSYYYNKLYTLKNNEVFSTLTNVIIKEIQYDIPDADEIGYENSVEKLFAKINNSLPTPLAFYRSNGEKLLNSNNFIDAPSRIKISTINELTQKRVQDRSRIISKEYENDQVLIPIYNTGQKVIGFFLTKKVDKETKYSGLYDFIATLITICVFLFLTALAFSMIIANPMTKGLKNLTRSLQNYKLGKNNEQLEWKSQDEIGALIENFNRLQIELNQSAEMLSKSQREMAWREMAKQVAHEIKNPLTPMKLSLQHAQMMAKSGDAEQLRKMIDKTSKTVLEQIENLTQIANEFSTFGTLPKSANDTFVINEVVEHIHDLFRKREDIEIMMDEPMNEILVFADKNQLVRILNNIVKNATQSIPEGVKGKILIELYTDDHLAYIKVKDNGTGIPESMKEKVFTPNFTTKSSGSGLGLAISSNMIESMNGKLYFNSPNDWGGTDFYIELPVVKSNLPEVEGEEILLD
jgi:signal transduction histidine kinase